MSRFCNTPENGSEPLKETNMEKLLMIHADDAGLSESENRATIECLKKGLVSSYSIMVPCRGFQEIALFAKENPTYDHGIHLTLTCEWHGHRFGPVSPSEEVASLVDENGHFYKTRQELKEHAKPDEVRKELNAQLEMALEFGLRPSHIDSHMYSVGANPEFFEIYRELGKQYGLPVFINKKLLKDVGLQPDKVLKQNDFVVEHAHLATFEHFKKGHLKTFYLDAIENLPIGLNVLLVHPAPDNAEMKAITVNHPNFGSKWRQMDYETLTSEELRATLVENNVRLVSWKEISKMQQAQNRV